MAPRDQDRPINDRRIGEKVGKRPLNDFEQQAAEEREWVQVPGARPGIQRNVRTGMWRNTARTP